MPGVSPEPVTALLKRWRHGDSAALEKLLPLEKGFPTAEKKISGII